MNCRAACDWRRAKLGEFTLNSAGNELRDRFRTSRGDAEIAEESTKKSPRTQRTTRRFVHLSFLILTLESFVTWRSLLTASPRPLRLRMRQYSERSLPPFSLFTPVRSVWIVLILAAQCDNLRVRILNAGWANLNKHRSGQVSLVVSRLTFEVAKFR